MKSLLFLSLLLGICLFSCKESLPTATVDYEKEKAAILQTIATETEAYFAQDYKRWRDTYLDTSYFRHYAYWEGYPEKVKFYNGFESLDTFKRKQFEEDRTLWKGSTEERANENFRIFPDVAWYTFEQTSYEKDTRKFLGKSLETRILEKHDGKWKIVYLAYHYLPMPTDSTAVTD